MEFQYRKGFNYPVPANEGAEELDRIKRKHGTLTPGKVVTESEPEDAPLHSVFTWDDPVAAHRYREFEARSYIRSVQVVHEGPSGTEVREPVYYNVRIEGQRAGRYETLDVLQDDPELFDAAMSQLRRKAAELDHAIAVLEARSVDDKARARARQIRSAAQALHSTIF